MLVTSFCRKKVYPVYVTIGNVPKEIRCKPTMDAHILLGYLPVTNLVIVMTFWYVLLERT